MVTVVFAIFVIPHTIMTFEICGKVIENLLQLFIVSIERRILSRKAITHFFVKTLISESFLTVLTLVLHAAIYTKMKILKDHRFVETFYFVFVTTSTIGFGDFEYNYQQILRREDILKVIFGTSNLIFSYVNLSLLTLLFSKFSVIYMTLSSKCKWRNRRT